MNSNIPTNPTQAASLGRLWMIVWLAVAVVLVGVSLSPDQQSPDQVASNSSIQEPSLTPVSYQAAEKELRSKLVHAFRPIESLRVGDRVIADNPDTQTPEATAVDPKTWRLVKLYAEERWPDGTLDKIHIESLQPPGWFELLGAEVGSEVPPPLDLVEMGLPEELRTKVTAIEPCPPIQIGNGRVVLTTVNHLNNDVWELAAVNSTGKLEKLRPTGLHKFYSETRGDWVSTKQIHDNEVIRGRAGPLTIVDSRPLEGTQRVYNLTVEGEHVYYVSELGLLAHNNGCSAERIRLGIGVSDYKTFQTRGLSTDDLTKVEIDDFLQSIRQAIRNERVAKIDFRLDGLDISRAAKDFHRRNSFKYTTAKELKILLSQTSALKQAGVNVQFHLRGNSYSSIFDAIGSDVLHGRIGRDAIDIIEKTIR